VLMKSSGSGSANNHVTDLDSHETALSRASVCAAFQTSVHTPDGTVPSPAPADRRQQEPRQARTGTWRFVDSCPRLSPDNHSRPTGPMTSPAPPIPDRQPHLAGRRRSEPDRHRAPGRPDGSSRPAPLVRRPSARPASPDPARPGPPDGGSDPRPARKAEMRSHAQPAQQRPCRRGPPDGDSWVVTISSRSLVAGRPCGAPRPDSAQRSESSRARRKPRPQFRRLGKSLPRLADRASSGPMDQQPPRITRAGARCEPHWAPRGSSTGERS
jgi:hypothetical protein